MQPGVVHQHVRTGGRGLGGVQVGEVEHARLDAAGQARRPLGQRLQAGLIPVDRSDLGAGGREPQGAGAADTAGGTGDEGRAAAEVERGGA
ncbi:hypothetical protein GCM10020295_08890 [Streptomyces cinereospinus]